MTALVALVHAVTGEVRRVAADDAAREAVGDWSVLAVVPAEPWRAEWRAMINRARDAAQDGGAPTLSGVFDSTSRSREFIGGAAQLALMAKLASAPFSIDWTRADNSVVTLDADAMIAVGQAVAGHVDAMQQRARVLKARIEAAETRAELEAITWTLED